MELIARLDIVVELAEIGIWDFDPKDTYLNWNDRAKKFIGLPGDARFTYADFIQSVDIKDRERIDRILTKAMKGEIKEYEIEYTTVGLQDKQERIILSRGRVLFDRNEQPLRIVGASRDMTAQRRYERDLEKAKQIADLANEAKNQFVANMSHEMRTPLGAILGFSELALEPQQNPIEHIKLLETIKRNADQLLNLVNDVLDLAKVEANKLAIEPVEFSLESLLRDTHATMSFMAKERGIDFVLKSSGPIPRTIKTDPLRVRQIIFNLINNAIKFTKQGQVEVTVRLLPPIKLGKPMQLEFEVSDTGIGVSPENQARLFEAFFQADLSMTRKYGGSGLGLWLSKRLAGLLNGNLQLKKSMPGQGSVFVFAFSDSVYTNETEFFELGPQFTILNSSQNSPAHQHGDLHGIRVLVVDDAQDNQILVRRFLEKAGATVEVAANGAEALEKATHENFDIVLMDIQMPVLDGYSATVRLRHLGYQQPIVALTAHAIKGEREKCLSMGFNDHLPKPINRSALINEVEKLTNHKHLH